MFEEWLDKHRVIRELEKMYKLYDKKREYILYHDWDYDTYCKIKKIQ